MKCSMGRRDGFIIDNGIRPCRRDYGDLLRRPDPKNSTYIEEIAQNGTHLRDIVLTESIDGFAITDNDTIIVRTDDHDVGIQLRTGWSDGVLRWPRYQRSLSIGHLAIRTWNTWTALPSLRG